MNAAVMAGETCICLDHINKQFGNKTVISNVSLSVENGEVFGLLGPSGAGKTTMIKILTGQVQPNGGKALLWNESCSGLSENAYSKIGMVLDDSGIYSRLSCYDNLALFCEIYGVDKSCIKDVMDKVGLADSIKKPAGKLSKGMKQRLVFARATMHNPQLLFLDEPTSGLDPATMLAIHGYIRELQSGGTTVFLTTHNMTEAAKLCDNVALLNDGNIVAYGRPAELCRAYDSERQINVLLKNGEELAFPNCPQSADKVSALLKSESIDAIHSSEPTLESVFIKLTGRKLV